MEYPEELLRGISSRDFIDANGRPTAALFQFSKKCREDGFREESINWRDDESAIDFLLNQKKDGSDAFQFSVGVAVIPKNWIDILMNQPAGDVLNYERSPLKDNPYHGNLLIKDNVTKPMKQLITASIAMGVHITIPNSNAPKKL